MPFTVTRHSNGRAFPNGEFDTKAEAEKHAQYVEKFHGKARGADVRVEKLGTGPDVVDEPGDEDDDLENPDEE